MIGSLTSTTSGAVKIGLEATGTGLSKTGFNTGLSTTRSTTGTTGLRGTSTGLGATGTGLSIQTGFVHCGGTGPVVRVAFKGGLIPVYPFAGIRTTKNDEMGSLT